MKPREIFEVCHARYKGLRAYLGGHMAAIDLESPSDGYHWRPDRARAEEFVADFQMIAERALRRPEWRGRQKLFRVYFLRGFEYRRAIVLCGVSAGTFDYWVDEVKKACGRAFSRAGLYPPGDYFHKRDIARPETPEDERENAAALAPAHRARVSSPPRREFSPRAERSMADILQEFTIKAPPARVFEIMATPQGLDRWWTKSSTGEATPNAEFTLDFGPGYQWKGKVTRCVPGSAFELTITEAHPDWLGTRVGCDIEPDGASATRVRFYHKGWPAESDHWRVSCYCWAMYLRLARRYLEHGEFVPYEQRLEV